ncbi:hypothetical protein QCN27_01470 [Cereibacter sp. SYSU M97828]|nr:hypothetical protein [Cereibacter flavus]
MKRALALLLLAACTTPSDTSRWVGEAETVTRARTAMIGMDETDVRMCAGFPAAQESEGVRGKIWTWRNSTDQGNLNISLPNVATGPLQGSAGAIGLSSSGTCHLQVRFEEGRVVQVEVAGDNNTKRSINATCVPMVDSCVAYADR